MFSEMTSKEQTTAFWQQILDRAQSAHKCMACDRDIQDKEIKAIETYVSGLNEVVIRTDI